MVVHSEVQGSNAGYLRISLRNSRTEFLISINDLFCVGGEMMGTDDRAGSSLPSADAQIASVALVNKLTVVTRNIKDLERMLDIVVNPFEPDWVPEFRNSAI